MSVAFLTTGLLRDRDIAHKRKMERSKSPELDIVIHDLSIPHLSKFDGNVRASFWPSQA